jgi:50S ribosomal subunit-associated GTPase HflX
LVLNKIDLVAKPKLLDLAQALNHRAAFAATFMISARSANGVGELKSFLAAQPQLQERAERVVHAIERILGAEPLPPRQAGQRGALRANDAIERVEDIRVAKSGHL